jgi:Peptidase family M49
MRPRSVRSFYLAIMAATAALAGLANAADAPADARLVAARPGIYAPVTLTANLSDLSAKERSMLGLFIDAAREMDDLFWAQTFPGDRGKLLAGITDPDVRRFVEINYGPWDRLEGNEPFVPGFGAKPPGAGYYPLDMTKQEFERADLPNKTGEYSVIRRDAAGKLTVVPYSVEWREPLSRAASLLEKAAGLAEAPGLARYLDLRAKALTSDDYRASEIAWLDMKDNRIDVVIGPIETYDDKLFGYKAAFEAYVLIKDMEWSRRLARYAAMLPGLQRGLPVPDAYKAEVPGTDSDLNAYDAVYYAGDCNTGAKTIAVNLPNDVEVQLAKGTRRLQLKNVMRAKFDKIMLPIAGALIAPEQRRHVTFDAFFANTMFHEVAHGLGIKNTVNGKGTVGDALKELDSGIEEGKADVLGLYMVTRLHDQRELDGALDDYYVTFLAGIFRSVRFGSADAHGEANMIRFNYFADRGAFARDAQGYYRVDMQKMRAAVDALSSTLLQLQGNGDYAGVEKLIADLGVIRPDLAADLARLKSRDIPVDVDFIQGKAVLGLD